MRQTVRLPKITATFFQILEHTLLSIVHFLKLRDVCFWTLFGKISGQGKCMVVGIRAYFNGLDFQTKMHSGQNRASKIGNFHTKSM